MKSIRVLLADDHTILRAGIRSLLDEVEGIEVVGEAADGNTALTLVKSHRPDIILADIAMPGLNGLELAACVARDYPQTKVIILTMHKDAEYVRRSLSAGAAGYLLKDADIDELALSLRAVSRGENYLSPAVSKHVVAAFRKHAGETSATVELTHRQSEVLRLIAEGKTTKAIARTLGISVKTVESHRALLMERLDIHDVAGLVRYALRVGLIAAED